MSEIVYRKESYAIMGACFNVYKDKGSGFLEGVYQECLAIEFEYQKIPFVAQKKLSLEYRGRKLKHIYLPDFICYDCIIIELKAVAQLLNEHRAQVMNYLNACQMQLGLLINFGHYPQLEYERIAYTRPRDRKIRETR